MRSNFFEKMSHQQFCPRKPKIILILQLGKYFLFFIFSAFSHRKKAIVRTLSVRPSQLLVFRGLTDRGDLWLDRKLMSQGTELWWKKIGFDPGSMWKQVFACLCICISHYYETVSLFVYKSSIPGSSSYRLAE